MSKTNSPAGFVSGFRPWTPAEESAAKQLRDDGKSHAQISDALDRSVASIKTFLLRHDGTQARSAKVKRRPCLCCGVNFFSEGPHNRLCPTCRRKDVSPYAS